MKFIHCADLHLDSPLQGLTRYQGAPVDEMREATRRAFEQLIALALQEPVEFVVIAGDLFDGDWPDFNTGLFFVDQMVRLNEAGIKVFMVRGNHMVLHLGGVLTRSDGQRLAFMRTRVDAKSCFHGRKHPPIREPLRLFQSISG
jgi:predicted MPP superfamily phosphohydrolase